MCTWETPLALRFSTTKLMNFTESRGVVLIILGPRAFSYT